MTIYIGFDDKRKTPLQTKKIQEDGVDSSPSNLTRLTEEYSFKIISLVTLIYTYFVITNTIIKIS